MTATVPPTSACFVMIADLSPTGGTAWGLAPLVLPVPVIAIAHNSARASRQSGRNGPLLQAAHPAAHHRLSIPPVDLFDNSRGSDTCLTGVHPRNGSLTKTSAGCLSKFLTTVAVGLHPHSANPPPKVRPPVLGRVCSSLRSGLVVGTTAHENTILALRSNLPRRRRCRRLRRRRRPRRRPINVAILCPRTLVGLLVPWGLSAQARCGLAAPLSAALWKARRRRDRKLRI